MAKKIKNLQRGKELRDESKNIVVTDIDLPFARVFWITVEFFLAGLLLAIVIAIPIIFFYLFFIFDMGSS